MSFTKRTGLGALFILLLSFTPFITEAQFSITGTSEQTIDFDLGFNGSGFESTPVAGQLDSDDWSITGFSDGDLAFGGSSVSINDLNRGVDADGGVSTGGVYAFEIGVGNIALGVQPGGSDFTPGSIILRIQNNTGSEVSQLDINYEVFVNNDEDRGNSFNFSHSPDNLTYTDVASADLTSAEAADALGFLSNSRSVSITGLSLANGDFFFLRWTGDDELGSGGRDEFALDNIGITATLATADVNPPTFVTGFPASDNVAQTSFDLQVQLDEPGTAYYAVVADGASAPSVADIFAGSVSGAVAQGNFSVPAASTTATENVTGLTAGTAYDVYVVAEDDEATPNQQTTAAQIDVTTTSLPVVTIALDMSTGSEQTPQQDIDITANASAAVTGDQTVDIVVSGTGIDGSDFTLSNTTITIADGNSIDGESLTILDDMADEGVEVATITLTNPSSGIVLGTPASAELTINDNDGTTPDVVINELRISSPGSGDDNSNYVEFFGPDGTDLTGLTLVVLSAEFNPGQIDFALSLDGSTIDEDGIVLLRNSGLASEITQTVAEANDIVETFDFFGSPGVMLLVEGFSGSQGSDLDAGDDGTLDSEPWTNVVDQVAYGNTEDPGIFYGFMPQIILDEPNPPAGLFRSPNETGAFLPLEFSDLTADTPGDVNPTEPSPILFDDGFATNPFNSGWTQFSAEGEFTWSYSADNQAVALNPFSQPGDGCNADDYFISPPFNVTNLDGVEVNISASSAFSGNNLEVFYSLDYDPSTDPNPNNATLVSLGEIVDPASGSSSFESVGFTSTALDALTGQVYLFIRNFNDDSNCASWRVNSVEVSYETISSTAVVFGEFNGNAREGVETTFDIEVNIINPDGSTATSADVVLTTVGSGSADDVESYTTQTVNFMAGSSTPQTVTLTITDDMLDEGSETLVFELQNVTGGDAAIAGPPSTFNFILDDNDQPFSSIAEIQGEAHTSPLNGQEVSTGGIVTAIDDNGFYIQSSNPDDNPNTSEGLYILSSTEVTEGDSVSVVGLVEEGAGDPGEVTRTQIGSNPLVEVESSSNPLPAPVVIGIGGRIPPTSAIDDGSFDDTFDPSVSGIDFYESLENMRVTVADPMAVSPVGFFDVYVVPNQGALATGLSQRKTLNIGPGDFNPEKIEIALGFNDLLGGDEDDRPTGAVQGAVPGTVFEDITGIVTYDRGVYEVTPTEDFDLVSEATFSPVTTTLQGSETELLIASYNVLNLDPNDSDEGSDDQDVANGRFGAVARDIVDNLGAPDIIGLQEVQDNSGSADDGTTAANETLQLLVDSIAAVGGPTYGFIDNTFILNNSSGGQPGGNIRTAFLFNPARVDTVNIPGDTVKVRTISSQEDGEAFEGARLPLVAAFSFNDTIVTVVNNHFSSKGGSAPIFGTSQPFQDRQEDVNVNGSLDERQAQSAAVQEFVGDYLSDNEGAPIVVMGDLNEFEFVSPVLDFESDLFNLTNTVPPNERYTFIFQGNSQALDHILVSPNLAINAKYQIAHLNIETEETDESASDHDPVVALLDMENFVSPPEGGQEVLAFSIQSSSDDAEEVTTLDGGAVGTVDGFEIGFVDLASSDIELVDDGFNGSNQIVGLRFADIDIPRGAIVLDAFIKFTSDTDGPGSGNDTVRTYIQIENDANPGTFTSELFNISSREVLDDTVVWDIFEITQAQADAREQINSASVTSLVQQIIDKPNWMPGNALSFRITGDGGERDFSSFDDDMGAAELVVNILPATGLVTSVVSSTDDAEEVTTLDGGAVGVVDGFDVGFVDLGSSDLEIVDDGFNGSNQIVGIRFATLNIPANARINNAFIQLTSDTDGSGSGEDTVNAVIKVQDDVNSSTFSDTFFDISSRDVVDDSVTWDILPIDSVQVANRAAINSPDVASLVQALVNREGWMEGNPITFIITADGGERDFSSADDDGPEVAPRLIVDFVETEESVSVAQGDDDAEEVTTLDGGAVGVVDGFEIGFVDVGSSDIEVVDDGFNGSNQIIGLRFGDVDVEPLTPIESAFIEFTLDTDGAGSNTIVTAYIQIEDTVNAQPFESELFNISSRSILDDTVVWVVDTVEDDQVSARERVATADVSSLIQKIIDRDDWQVGNAIGFRITGDGGERDFSSANDDGPEVAPRLVINFAQSEGNVPPEVIASIPDVKTSVGGTFNLDLNQFFKDEDTPLSYFLRDLRGNEVPSEISIDENGRLTGSLNESRYLPIEVFAHSFGDTVSTSFNLIVSPISKGVLRQVSSVQLATDPDEGAAEISAFDPSTDLLFVTNAEINAVEVIDFSDPSDPVRIDTINVTGDVNSVAVGGGNVAIAVANSDAQLSGTVDVYATADFIGGTPALIQYTVGALPDMVTFANDTTILVANEGEPNDDYTTDPEGSVSIIDLTDTDLVAAVQTADFTAFNGQEASLKEEGVRIFGPGASVAEDLEPEFITVIGDSAYVSLQENNALAIVRISTATVEDVVGLGFKDHSQARNGIDANNNDDTPILIDSRLPIKGMYQPDAIASLTVGGTRYVLTANEGDARDYDTFSEETEIGDIELDPAFFPNAELVEELADGLTISTVADTNAMGQYQEIFAFGSRSFTIWNASTLELAYDSKDEFEQITASLFPENFNASNTNNNFKNRSDDKGPEPEAIAVGTVGAFTYAFVGLERIGGIMVYDISNINNPTFIEYINNRNFDFDPDGDDFEQAGDNGPEGLVFVPADQSPNGTALLVVSNEISGTVTTYEVGEPIVQDVFTLELLHVADQEAGGPAIQDAPRLSAVMNALEAEDLGNDNVPDNTLRLSSGDAFIPGLFFDASSIAFGSGGVADFQIQNELGFKAISFGNHEFDFGTELVADLISGNAEATFDLPGTELDNVPYSGTTFTYLSSNLNYGPDEFFAPLEIAPGVSPQPGRVSSSSIVDVNGETIGVVGATTPRITSISSPGDIGVSPLQFGNPPDSLELDSLAAIIQADVDFLLDQNPGLNKVILLAHMQSIDIEFALAERLTDVDIIVAGGSNTRLFDGNDRPRAGDSNQGEYPTYRVNPDGDSVAVVNTDGSYKYVGRLVIDFDDEGKIIPASYDSLVSGAYATDSMGVADLMAENLVDPEIQAIADSIEAAIISQESNVFGIADVFLNGNRTGANTGTDPDGVRSQETNLGNLTADANLVIAQQTEADVAISIKNGGGIRASIGRTIVPPGGSGEAERLPNEEIIDSEGNVVKPAGGISQNDINTTLAFNNALTLLTLTKAQLVEVLEHGVGDIGGGQFAQVAGVRYSFDPDLPVGERIVNAILVDNDGERLQQLVADGEIAGDPAETFRIVTLNFLAEGGDGYPFPTDAAANRVDLNDVDGDGVDDGFTGDATFAPDGTEQDALAEYLQDNFFTTPFSEPDAGPSTDERIQNLAFRADGIGNGVLPVVNVSVAPATVDEGGSVTVTVTADLAVMGAQTVDVAFTGVDASDLTNAPTSVSIADGATSGTATVTVADDADEEQAEAVTVTISNPSEGIELGTTTTATFTINANDQLLGFDGNVATGLSVYPVPTSDVFFIKSEKMKIAEIRIITALGEELRRMVPSGNENSFEMNISDLETGMYILQMIDGDTGEVISTRILKQ